MRITGAGLKESHVHDVSITRGATQLPDFRLTGMQEKARIAAAIEILDEVKEGRPAGPGGFCLGPE